MIVPFSDSERAELRRAHQHAMARYNEAMDEWGRTQTATFQSSNGGELLDRATAHLKDARSAEADYFERAPRRPLSCCPHCGKPLYRSFDPFGLDGLWWRSDATPAEPIACPHFCALLGAVDLGDGTPRGGSFDAHPGPGAPFVVPRLLNHDGMVAVMGRFQMTDGLVAYPIAYFAERRPPPEDLTAGWARTNFVYTTQLGVDGWRLADEELDFELKPWLDAGKLRWCTLAQDGAVLSDASPDRCPYLNLFGERRRAIVHGETVRFETGRE